MRPNLSFVFKMIGFVCCVSISLSNVHAQTNSLSTHPNSTLLPISAYSPNIEFIANKGQLFDQAYKPMPEVRYYCDAQGVRLYAAENALHFVFARNEGQASNTQSAVDRMRTPDTAATLRTLYRTDLTFDGASLHPTIDAEDKAEEFTNYYLPSCPDGLTNVPAFHTIIYRELYPHIDMQLVTNDGVVKYEFIVHPGGDPSMIRMHYDDRERINLQLDGSLSILNPFGKMTEPKPITMQGNQTIESHFINTGNTIGFVIAPYDSLSDLIIDPPRVWSTYYGGFSSDQFLGVAADGSGNIYACGVTASSAGISTAGTFQTTFGGSADAMLVKFSSSGARVWGTYIGGTGADDARAVILDHNGDILITGATKSTVGIATINGYQTTHNYPGSEDVMLLKFTSAGARTWGTYYGTANRDWAQCLGVDASNNVYIGGTWNGSPNYGSAFVAKFNSSGTSLVWATTYGGSDLVFGIGLDASANCYATGLTSTSAGFATVGAHQTVYGGGGANGFVTKLNSLGSIAWNTYYGGAGYDGGYGIAVDPAGNSIYVVGQAGSSTNISTSGAQQTTRGTPGPNAFLSKWTNAGVLSWGTYYGGAGSDFARSVMIDQDQNVVMTGATYSTTNIATAGEYQTSLASGSYNAFLAKFTPSGGRLWGTYYGSGNYEWGQCVAIDSSNFIIVGGITDDNTGFIATTGAQQTSNGGGDDAFLTKFCGILTPPILNSGRDTICQGSSATLSVPTGYSSYQWKLGGVAISGATGNTYSVPTNLTPGIYNYSIAVSNSVSCAVVSLTRTLTVKALPTAVAGANQIICSGSPVSIGGVATGGTAPYIYSWSPTTGLSNPNVASPTASPLVTTTYTVTVQDSNGCQNSASVAVTVNPKPTVSVTHIVETCAGTPITIGGPAANGLTPYSYAWTPATGLSSTSAAQPTANPSTETKYYVTITDGNSCQVRDSVDVVINALPTLSTSGNTSICQGGHTTLTANGAGGTGSLTYAWAPATGLSSTTISNPIANPTTNTNYQVTVTDTKGCIASQTISVTVNPNPTPTLAASGPLSICDGDSVLIGTTVSYASYLWSNGSMSSTIAVKQPGTFSVAVIDANGCGGNSNSLAVVVHTRPVALIGGPTSACPNSSSIYQTPAQSGLQYLWKISGGGSITSGQNASSATVLWSSTGTWNVSLTVTDPSTGCSKDTSLSVIVNSVLVPTVSLSGTTTLCQGDSLVISAQSGYSSYKWSTGESTTSIVVKQSGSYTVQVTSAGGCAGTSQPVTVQALAVAKPTPTIAASSNTICQGDSAQLKASGNYSSYLWSDGSTSQNIYAKKAGTYSVTATNSNGCQGISAPLPITVLPSPPCVISAAGPTTFCEGGNVTLSATPGFSTYRWSTGETTTSIQAATAGSYSVTVTNANGCTRTAQAVTVIINPTPKPTIKGPVAVCANSKAIYSIIAISGSTVVWNVTNGTILSGQNTAAITIQWGAVGTAKIDVDQSINTTSCKGSAPSLQVTIGTSLKPQVTTTGGKTVLCGAGDSLVVDAGSGYASYAWSTGENKQSIVIRTAGTYSVTVDNGSGCTGSSDPITISQSQPPSPTIAPKSALAFCQGDSVTLDAGTGYASYQWSMKGVVLPSAVQELYVARQAGQYSVDVTNTAGCLGSAPAQTVMVYPLPLRPTITELNGVLTSTTANSYQWNLNGSAIVGATSQSVTPSASGDYSVTIADINGCSNTSLPITITNGGSTVIGVPALIFAKQGQQVVIPLSIITSQNLPQNVSRDFTAVLRFNKTLLVPGAGFASSTVRGNDLIVTYNGTTNNTTGVIANLDFIAALGNDSCTFITIDSFAWRPASAIQVTATDGRFCLSNLCQQGGTRLIDPDGKFSLGMATPNPATDAVQIDYEVLEKGRTTLVVLDVLGREVRRLVDRDMDPGKYTVVADLRTVEPGSYLYVLTGPHERATRHLNVVR
jgi:hypothetical protein